MGVKGSASTSTALGMLAATAFSSSNSFPTFTPLTDTPERNAIREIAASVLKKPIMVQVWFESELRDTWVKSVRSEKEKKHSGVRVLS